MGGRAKAENHFHAERAGSLVEWAEVLSAHAAPVQRGHKNVPTLLGLAPR